MNVCHERHHRLHHEQSDQEKRCSERKRGQKAAARSGGRQNWGSGGRRGCRTEAREASRARLVGLGRQRFQVLHQREQPEACGLNARDESLLDRSWPEVLRIQIGHDPLDRLPTGGVIAPRFPYPARHSHLLLVPQGEACGPRRGLAVDGVAGWWEAGTAV